MLPEFNTVGDLPPGIHRASLSEVVARFSAAYGQRARIARRLEHIYELAQRTGHLERFILFGSYVTDKSEPNDVDLILVMDNDFHLEKCPYESRGLFDHAVAQARFGASLFWIRPVLLIGENLKDFIAGWQLKRDGSQRGIVEVVE